MWKGIGRVAVRSERMPVETGPGQTFGAGCLLAAGGMRLGCVHR